MLLVKRNHRRAAAISGVDPMCFSGSGPTHFLGAGTG